MREMVLNHASLPGFTQSQIIGKLKDIAVGMALLVNDGVTCPVLRTCKPINEIYCTPNHSLFHAFLSLNRAGAKEEFSFLISLAGKTPLMKEVQGDIKSRFLACETVKFSHDDGKPMLLCALTDWVAVGFPNSPWDCDQITIRFNELLPNGTIETIEEKIDNLTRSDHAGPIRDRHQSLFRTGLDLRTLWENRNQAFPNLILGPEVEEQLSHLPINFSHTVIHRLTELHSAASDWQKGETMPRWPCKVTPEGSKVMNNPKFRHPDMVDQLL